jgi:GrpB-like predicted nucleotidyltransferase (UPF0157 family)
MVLGLRKGAVRIIDFDNSWPQEFREFADWLRGVLAMGYELEHIGSTSVPGLAAKPILDVAVAVPRPAEVAVVRATLVSHGWVDRGDQGVERGWVLVRESPPGIRTHHLHVVVAGDPQWRRWLSFRDALVRDPELVRSYMERKRELAARFSEDRASYTAGKAAFVAEVLASVSSLDA